MSSSVEDASRSGLGRRRAPSVLLLLALLGFGAWWTRSIPANRDIGLFDESSYMARGLAIPRHGAPEIQHSPLYTLWYLGLAPFAEERVDLYHLVHRSTVVALPLAFASFLLLGGAHRWTAGALSLWLLVSPLHQGTWPRVSHFALVVLFLGSGLVTRLERRRDRSLVGLLVGISLSLVRPELFLGCVLLVMVLVMREWRPPETSVRGAWLRAGLVAGSILFVLSYSFVFLGAGDRQLVAFGQHYAVYTHTTAEGDEIEPWWQWRTAVERDFGDVEGVGEALRANPSAWIGHVGRNLARFPGALIEAFGRLVTGRAPRPAGWILVGVLVVSCLTARPLRFGSRGSADGDRCGREILVAWAVLLAVPVVLTCLVVYPRPHYLILLVVPSLALWSVRVFPADSAPSIRSWIGRSVVLGVALAVAATSGSVDRDQEERPLFEMLQAIRQADLDGPLVIVEAEGADGGFCKFLEAPCRRVAPETGEWTVEEMLGDPEIDVVVASEAIERFPWIREDPAWSRLLEDPERFGFRRSPVHRDVLLRVRSGHSP